MCDSPITNTNCRFILTSLLTKLFFIFLGYCKFTIKQGDIDINFVSEKQVDLTMDEYNIAKSVTLFKVECAYYLLL